MPLCWCSQYPTRLSSLTRHATIRQLQTNKQNTHSLIILHNVFLFFFFCWFVRLLGLSCSLLIFVDDFSSAKIKNKTPTNSKKKRKKRKRLNNEWIIIRKQKYCDGFVSAGVLYIILCFSSFRNVVVSSQLFSNFKNFTKKQKKNIRQKRNNILIM